MATAAQTAANRRNARASTGPRTAQGKRSAAANAATLGLFSSANHVRPHEQREYDLLTTALWRELTPVGALEDMLATEVLRCAWRLRRCAAAEEQLASELPEQSEQDLPLPDAILQPQGNQAQVAIDRARGQALSCLRRAMADLSARQTERFLRLTILPAGADPAALGLASVRPIAAAAAEQARHACLIARAGEVAAAEAPEAPASDHPAAEPAPQNEPDSCPSSSGPQLAKRTQSAPSPLARNAPCPCRSGQKYKRCCGRLAPAVLQTAA